MVSAADAEHIHLIDRYLSGEHSGRPVSEIEGIVIESFQNAEWYDDVGEALALTPPEKDSRISTTATCSRSSDVYAPGSGAFVSTGAADRLLA